MSSKKGILRESGEFSLEKKGKNALYYSERNACVGHAEEMHADCYGGRQMIDYDELDAVLAKEDEALAAAQKKQEEESQQAFESEITEEEREYLDAHYQIDLSRAEAVRNKLEVWLESARKDYDQVDRDKKNACQDMLGYIFAWLFHTAGYPVVYVAFGTNIISAVAFGLLGIFWVFYTGKFFLKVLNSIVNYFVLSDKRHVSAFVEKNQILTFEKKRAHALQRINYIKGQLAKLDNFEKKMEHQHGLSAADSEAMNSLALIRDIPTPYKEYKTSFREYFKFMTRGTSE